MENTRFSGMAGSRQSFQGEQRHHHEWIAGILRSLGENIPDPLRTQLDALSKEGSAEFCLQGLLHLGRELGKTGDLEKAGVLLGAVRAQSDFPELRRQAESEADALSGVGGAGLRTEVLLSGFRREATDYRTIVPMLAGTVVGSLAKSATLSRLLGRAPGALLSRGIGAKAAAGLVSYAVEVPVFALANHALSHGSRALSEDIAGSALSLGAMKLAHVASAPLTLRLAKSNPLLSAIAGQGTTLLALAGSRRLEESVGLRQALAGATFWLDTAGSLVGLGVGGHLGHRFLGPRFAALQRELEYRAERRADTSSGPAWGMGGFGWQFAINGAEALPKAKPGKSLAELAAEPVLMSLSGGDPKSAPKDYAHVSKETFDYLGLKIEFELVSHIEVLNLDRVREHLRISLLDILLEGKETRIPLKGDVASTLRNDLAMRGRLFENEHSVHVRVDVNTGKIVSFLASLAGKSVWELSEAEGTVLQVPAPKAPESELQHSAVVERGADREVIESESISDAAGPSSAPPTMESVASSAPVVTALRPIEPRLPRPEKLTELQSHIWDMLPNPFTEMIGMDVIRRLEEAGIQYNPSTIYRALKRLVERGILQVRVIPNTIAGFPDVSHFRLALGTPLPDVSALPAPAKPPSTLPSAANTATETRQEADSPHVVVFEAEAIVPSSEPADSALTIDQALIKLSDLARLGHPFQALEDSFRRIQLYLETSEWPEGYQEAVTQDLLAEIQDWLGMNAEGEEIPSVAAYRYFDKFLRQLKAAQAEYQLEIWRQSKPGTNFAEWLTIEEEAVDDSFNQVKPYPLRLTPQRERYPWQSIARSFRSRDFFISASLEGRFPKGRTLDTWQSPKIDAPSIAKIAPQEASEIPALSLSEPSIGHGMAWRAIEQRIETLERERVAPHYEASGLRRAQDFFHALAKARRELPAAQAHFLLDLFENTLGDGSQVAQQAGTTLETMLRFKPLLSLLRRMHRMGGAEQHWAADADAKFHALLHPAHLNATQLAKAVEGLESELRDHGGLHSNRSDQRGRTPELNFDDVTAPAAIRPKPSWLESKPSLATSLPDAWVAGPLRVQGASELPNYPIEASAGFYDKHIKNRLLWAKQLLKEKTPALVKAETNRLLEAIAAKFWSEKYANLSEFRRELGKARALIAGAVDEASYGQLTMVEALRNFSSELGAKPQPDPATLQDFRLKSWFWLMRDFQPPTPVEALVLPTDAPETIAPSQSEPVVLEQPIAPLPIREKWLEAKSEADAGLLGMGDAFRFFTVPMTSYKGGKRFQASLILPNLNRLNFNLDVDSQGGMSVDTAASIIDGRSGKLRTTSLERVANYEGRFAASLENGQAPLVFNLEAFGQQGQSVARVILSKVQPKTETVPPVFSEHPLRPTAVRALHSELLSFNTMRHSDDIRCTYRIHLSNGDRVSLTAMATSKGNGKMEVQDAQLWRLGDEPDQAIPLEIIRAGGKGGEVNVQLRSKDGAFRLDAEVTIPHGKASGFPVFTKIEAQSPPPYHLRVAAPRSKSVPPNSPDSEAAALSMRALGGEVDAVGKLGELARDQDAAVLELSELYGLATDSAAAQQDFGGIDPETLGNAIIREIAASASNNPAALAKLVEWTNGGDWRALAEIVRLSLSEGGVAEGALACLAQLSGDNTKLALRELIEIQRSDADEALRSRAKQQLLKVRIGEARSGEALSEEMKRDPNALDLVIDLAELGHGEARSELKDWKDFRHYQGEMEKASDTSELRQTLERAVRWNERAGRLLKDPIKSNPVSPTAAREPIPLAPAPASTEPEPEQTAPAPASVHTAQPQDSRIDLQRLETVPTSLPAQDSEAYKNARRLINRAFAYNHKQAERGDLFKALVPAAQKLNRLETIQLTRDLHQQLIAAFEASASRRCVILMESLNVLRQGPNDTQLMMEVCASIERFALRIKPSFRMLALVGEFTRALLAYHQYQDSNAIPLEPDFEPILTYREGEVADLADLKDIVLKIGMSADGNEQDLHYAELDPALDKLGKEAILTLAKESLASFHREADAWTASKTMDNLTGDPRLLKRLLIVVNLLRRLCYDRLALSSNDPMIMDLFEAPKRYGLAIPWLNLYH